MRLYLLRHAKSSWEEPGPDRARPLSARGRRAAPAMAERMRDQGLVPARVLCSPATRTRQTWALMRPILGADLPVAYPDALYHAGPAGILDVIRGAEAGPALMVVGHNPGLQATALALCGTGSPELRERMATKFPTAALAAIEFDVLDWAEVARGTGELAHFVRPKDLPDAVNRGL